MILSNIILEGRPVDIVIGGETIEGILPAGSVSAAGGEILDCSGKTAFPAFVNMHTHAAMSLMRGMQEDVPFGTWIERIWRMEENVDPDFVYWGTKVACLEMIRTGTAIFNDQYWFSPSARLAADEMGLLPVVSYVVLDRFDSAEAERQKEQCLKMYEESLKWKNGRFAMAFHAVYSVSEEMMLWTADFARRHGLRLHIHLSETRQEVRDCMEAHGGLSPVAYLDRLGILGGDTIAAHCVWLSEDDVRILGERKVNCVHNINSNAKLCSGYRFLYNELRDAGANLCLGTDGCASSNNLDMLEAMKTSALFQKSWRDDPKAMPLAELRDMATLNGARALGIDSGRIAAGARADILIIGTDSSFFLSPGSFEANLVYSAHSDCIESVISGGRAVMRDRKIEGERQILANAREVLKKII